MTWFGKNFRCNGNEGAFTGNGQLGFMMFVDTARNSIMFHIGRLDVTDHRNAPDRKTSMGVGRSTVFFDFPRLDIGKMALLPAGKIKSGTIRQDLWNAEIRGTILTTKGTLEFRAFTPRNQMVQVIDVTSSETEGTYQWQFLPGNPASPRAIVFPSQAKDYITNPEPLVKPGKVSDCVQRLLAGGDYATAWTERKAKKGTSSTLFVTTANEVPLAGKSEITARRNIAESLDTKPLKLGNEHREWWHAFYQKSFLTVPDARMESFYWIQLYKRAISSRPDGQTVDLFGPVYRTSQWPGIWWNLNIQLAYWPVYATNHLELGENYVVTFDSMYNSLVKGSGVTLGDIAWALHNYWRQYRYVGNWKTTYDKWLPKALIMLDAYEKKLIKDSVGRLQLLPLSSPEYHGFKPYPLFLYKHK